MDIETQKKRNNDIVQDYQDGKDPAELSRIYKLTTRRVRAILKENGVSLRPRKTRFEKEAISPDHERLGRKLVDFQYDRKLEPVDMANKLDWPVSRYKKACEGIAELELIDLIDIYQVTGLNAIQLGAEG